MLKKVIIELLIICKNEKKGTTDKEVQVFLTQTWFLCDPPPPQLDSPCGLRMSKEQRGLLKFLFGPTMMTLGEARQNLVLPC